MKRDLCAEVSQRIVSELERGAAPWLKPWSATPGQNVPQNAVTNRPYSGCNVILLWLARSRGWRGSHARSYPSRPVRIVVPFPAGGPTDIVARLAAQGLSERFRQQFVVENRPGAGGNIGTEAVARAPADYQDLAQGPSLPGSFRSSESAVREWVHPPSLADPTVDCITLST
jgi:N-terminal domain of anti-restriction factor ArdC/Tripartite tricarboxylate transporter family receptor